MNIADKSEARAGWPVESCNNASLGATGGRSLAAAPTFAVMAIWIGLSAPRSDVLCMSDHGALSLTGMAAMYALMCIFHTPPWLALVANRATVECGKAAVNLGGSLLLGIWTKRSNGTRMEDARR